MKLLRFFSMVLLLSTAVVGNASAEQGCPDGFTPNAAGTPGVPCVAIGGLSRPGAGSSGGGVSEPHFARRWGAFASDPVTSKVGVATGFPNKRKAEKEAIAHCRSKGGVDCKTLIAYYDQCAAVVWGPDSTGKGDLISSRAAQKEEAEELALGECAKNSNSCKVFFAECSYAERTN